MPFDWSALWPVIAFLPFFAWIAFSGRRTTPLTSAERRRALVIGSIGAGVGILLGVGGLCYLAAPRPAPPAIPPQPQVVPAPAPVVVPRVRVPQAR